MGDEKKAEGKLEELGLYRGESKIISGEQEQVVDDNEIIEIEFFWGGRGYMQAKEVKKTIDLRIKTFIGDRKIIRVTVPITSNTEELYEEVSKKFGEDMKLVSCPSFYYPMGVVRQLKNPVKTLSDFRIPDNAQLIMMAKKCFKWSGDKKPDNLEISNDGLTAKVVRKDDCSGRSGNTATILGDTPMSSGRHFWSIKLDNLNHNDDSLAIGICYEDLNRSAIPMNSGLYWGFQPIICQKFSPDNTEGYGTSCSIGDTIGVLLEFKNMYGTLSFFKNGQPMGHAERNLVGSFYPAVSFFAPDSQVTLDHSKKPAE